MKNKVQFFSLSLYIDALKQLRVMGIMMLVFVGFVSTSIVLLNGGNYMLFSLSLFSFTIFSPAMTLYIFRFLTSRKASDMFHSLPHTRVSLYFSYVFAVLTYVIAILSVNFISQYFQTGEFEIIDFKMLISLIVCNLLVISAITLAQGMTGTIFTNISVAGLILFFPRLLIYFVTSFVCEFCPYINMEYIKFPFGISSNILTGMFTGGYSLRYIANLESIIYTFVLSLIYFAIAAVLFNKRKSEMAGAPATNRLAQHIIRLIITLVICLIPLSDILSRCASDVDYYYGDFFDDAIVIIYLFAIFMYFLYELLSTKKLKNLIKIIPGIIVVVILNVVIALSVFGISDKVKKFQPKAEDVEYIIIHNDDERFYYGINDESYLMEKVDGVKITDDRIIELVCQQFEVARNSRNWNYYNGEGYNFTFYVDGKVYDRYFEVNETGFNLMLKYLLEDERIVNDYKTLPKYDKLSGVEIIIEGIQYKGDDVEEIYEKYREELMRLSDDNIIKNINDESFRDIGYIEIEYNKDKESHYLNLPFIKELPNIYNTYLAIANENIETSMSNFVAEVTKSLSKADEFYFAVTVNYDEFSSEYLYFGYDEIIKYEDKFLDEKILLFCKEAVDTYSLPNIEEVIFEIEFGNKEIVFSASDRCLELFAELRKYN